MAAFVCLHTLSRMKPVGKGDRSNRWPYRPSTHFSGRLLPPHRLGQYFRLSTQQQPNTDSLNQNTGQIFSHLLSYAADVMPGDEPSEVQNSTFKLL